MSTVAETPRTIQLEQITKSSPFGRFGNGEIWLSLIAAVNRKWPNQPFSGNERDKIISAYESFGEANLSVGDLVREGEVFDLGENEFLDRVCFNYSHQLGAGRRHQQALDELARGERRRIGYTDPDVISVRTQVEMDFERPLGELYQVYEQAGAYALSGSYPSRFDQIYNRIAPFVALFSPVFAFGITRPTYSWEYVEKIEDYWSKNSFPLLKDNELLKAAPGIGRPSYMAQLTPTIAERTIIERTQPSGPLQDR